MTETPAQNLIFVADPMCSWCWGFSPVMRQLRDEFGGKLGISVLVGGLRPGTTEPMDEAMSSSIRHHWKEVHEKTGQPFDFSFFERDGFIYDTEPSCRAVVTVRGLNPGATLDYLEDLHRANYAKNRDITDASVLADIAAGRGVDADDFAENFASDQMRAATKQDFHAARSLGITGFPSIVARRRIDGEEDQYAFLTLGYRPYEALQPLLAEWTATG